MSSNSYMTAIIERYLELIRLTQLYLLQEFTAHDLKQVDPIAFAYFKTKISHQPLKTASPVVTQRSPTIDDQTSKTIKSQPTPPSIPPIQAYPLASAPQTLPLSTTPQAAPPVSTPQAFPHTSTPSQISNEKNNNATPPQKIQHPHPSSVSQAEKPSPPLPAQMTQLRMGKAFLLEPFQKHACQPDFKEFWKTCPALFPDWKLSESIPSDSLAKKNKDAWLKNQEVPTVIILSFQENVQQLTFLKNIAHAITLRLAPTRIISASQIEKDNQWEAILKSAQLQLIISSDYGLYLQPQLMQHYKEIPGQSKHTLNNIPLLLLSDISLYLKEPQLKPLLWRAICNEFAIAKT